MSITITDYFSKDGSRHAVIDYSSETMGDSRDQLLVSCYINDELVHSIDCTNHSMLYAENAAENFTLEIIEGENA